MDREIKELPSPPPLSRRAIKGLTKLCFRQDSNPLPPTEGIFIFGSTISLDELSKKIHELIEKKVATRLIITGGIVTYCGCTASSIPQSKMIYQMLQKFSHSDVEILLEEKSQNTFDNVQFGLSLIKTTIHSLCFITKSFHCGRSYLTLRKVLPKTALFQYSYDPIYPREHQKINAENWSSFHEGRARVWGEFLRIRKYGQRGDISIAEVEELISEIEESVQLCGIEDFTDH
jgi:hypothetical protein